MASAPWTAILALGAIVSSCKGSNSDEPPSPPAPSVEQPPAPPAAGVSEVSLDAEPKPSPDTGKKALISPEPKAKGTADAAPKQRGQPQATASEDLDRDGAQEAISLWCNAEDDQEEEGKLIVQVGEAVLEVEPELSDMIGCSLEVTAPKRGPRLLWVVAEEHDEVGASTHYLLAYDKGQLELLWEKSADVSMGDGNNWSTQEWYCDEEEKKETTTTTEYKLVKGKVRKTTSRKSKAIDPSECESFDP